MLYGRGVFFLLMCLLLIPFSTISCRSSNVNRAGKEPGIIVVDAPITGEIRRFFISEGATVTRDAPIAEIVVHPANQPSPGLKTGNPETDAQATLRVAQSETDAARAEVVRTETEVGRLTPLVASNQATQAELDGARANYDKAQQQFQQARAKLERLQDVLVAARQPGKPASAATPPEQVITVRASAAGTVRAINGRVGEQVTTGQPLVTMSANAP